jgi:hypothetical protein
MLYNATAKAAAGKQILKRDCMILILPSLQTSTLSPAQEWNTLIWIN